MASNDQLREWLRSIDLSRVAVSAITDDQGNLSPVGSMDEKLLGLLDELKQEEDQWGGACIAIVAHEQPIRAGLDDPDARPLRVIKAHTLAEAIQRLYEEDGPRAAVARHEQQAAAELSLLDRTVSIDSRLYQSLPLLREVKRERLPHRTPGDGRPSEGAGAEDESQEPAGRLRQAKMLRWEEAMRQEQVHYEPHQLEKLFAEKDFRRVVPQASSEVPRFVVLGPPGSGKTTLEQFLVYRFARGQWTWRGRRLLPLRVRLRDWETWAANVAEASLPDFLAHQYKNLRPAAPAEQFRRWLRLGDVQLLLDGLDEIDGKERFVRHLGATLGDFADCPTVITCRTVSYEQHRQVCPKFPVFTLAGLDDQQRNAYIAAYPPRHPDRFDRAGLIRQLDQLPAMRPLAANPLLLSIICFVVDVSHGVALPATRAELYDHAVRQLLDHYARNPRVDVAYPAAPPDLGEKQIILERAVLWLFAGSHEKLSFGGEQLGKALRQALAAVDYGEATAPWANALREDLVSNSGLLRADRGQQELLDEYFFLHLSVEEFLAASALARIVNDPHGLGWDTEIELDGRRRTVRDLVDKKAWDPRWQEVVCLMAGRLSDPTPLLKMLAEPKPTRTNPTGDDYFRHRLALAALCMAEIPAPIRSRDACQNLVDRITTDAFSLWWAHRGEAIGATVSRIQQALPALGQVNGRVPVDGSPENWSSEFRQHANSLRDRTPLLDRLAGLLRDPDNDVRRSAAEAAGRLGAAAATPALLDHLAVMLRDPDSHVGMSAAEAVGRLGAAAATPAFLEHLVAMLRDPDLDVHVPVLAAQAAGRLGAAAATSAILEQLLVALLGDPSPYVQPSAAVAIERLGAAAATPPILQRLAMMPDNLAAMFRHPDSHERRSTAETLGRLRAAAATPAFLEHLAAMLRDPDSSGRLSARQAIRHLGPAAANPAILEQVAAMLRDPNYNWRSLAEEAVGSLGPAAATPPILQYLSAMQEQLPAMFHHPDYHERERAAETLGRLGAAAATPAMLEHLAALFGDPVPAVRCHAAFAVRALGPAAATPPILEQLAGLLRDRQWSDLAEKTIGRLGATAATPPFLEHLAALFRHPDSGVRSSAAEVVGALGAAAAKPAILEQLAAMLRDPDFYVRRSAEEAVGHLGAAAATPAFLEHLAALFRHPDSGVRFSAAQAVGALGPAAATPPILEQLAALLRDPDSNVYFPAPVAVAVDVLLGAGLRLFRRRSYLLPGRRWRILKVEDLSK